MKVVKFVTYSEAEIISPGAFGVSGGFFDNGMRWEDYKEMWNDEHTDTMESIRAAIIENKIRCTGEQHQHTDYKSCPVLDDGTAVTYSYRAWGDLMAAVWSSEDNKDYSYMDFYM